MSNINIGNDENWGWSANVVVLIPTYGLYGGPTWTGGQYGGNNTSMEGLDSLDKAFRRHDIAYGFKETPLDEIAADLRLVRDILFLDVSELLLEEFDYAILALEVFVGKILFYNTTIAPLIGTWMELSNWMTSSTSSTPNPIIPGEHNVKFDIESDGFRDLFGTIGNDYIIGGPGIDYIYGKAGQDTLKGGSGDDKLFATYQDSAQGAGNDYIYGGTDTDTVVFDYSYDPTRISLDGDFIVVGAPSGTNGGWDRVFTDVEWFQFGIINPQLWRREAILANISNPGSANNGNIDGGGDPPGTVPGGSDGGAPPPAGSPITGTDTPEHLKGTNAGEVMRGLGGNDVLTGYSGDDTFEGGTGSDTVDYSYNPASVIGIVSLGAGMAVFPGFYIETFTSIENLWMGAGNDDVAGDGGANDLRGGPGNDTLNGLGGNDVIYGDWKYSDQGGIDTAILSYTFGGAYAVSGSANALHIVGAEGDDWYYNVENFRFAGGVARTAQAVLDAANTGTNPPPPVIPPPDIDPVFLTILDSGVREGTGAGLTTLTFDVILTGPGAGARPITAVYRTEVLASSPVNADGFDFVSTSSTLVIPQGQTRGTITISIQPDTVLENDEVFGLRLSEPSTGVTLLDLFATGTIFNDDAVPNRFPLPQTDIAITSPNTQIAIDVLANDIDPDGDYPLSVTSIGYQDGPGTISVGPGGANVLFTPSAGFSGVVGFFYTIVDARGATNYSHVNVVVAGDGTLGISNPGTTADDTIGGTSGNDTLSGGLGDDTIAGGPGADRIDGGTGFDLVDLRQAAHGANISLEWPWVFDDGDGGEDVLTNIEGVLGTAFDDYIDGSLPYNQGGDYRFYGFDGNDRLTSDAGNDVLDGGAGNDILRYGKGQDTVLGGLGNDQIYSFSGADTIGDNLDGGDGDDIVTAWEQRSPDDVRGGDGNDTLQIGDGDTATGGTGTDIFWIGYYGILTDQYPQYRASITDLRPGEEIRWAFPTAVVSGSELFWFVGPITTGTGASTGHNRIEFSSGGGETKFFFGYDTTPGADFILTLTGTFGLDQFQVDASNRDSIVLSLRPVDQIPVAQPDAITVDEDSPTSGNLLADNGQGADSDPNGDPLTISAVNDAATNVGQAVTLASGAVIVVAADGQFVYDPNGAFENLGQGQTANDSFTYSISDGQGHTTTATVTLTIAGADDGVRIVGSAAGETHVGTAQDDQIDAREGDDTIYGGAGFDWLLGGAGADTIRGEDGVDWLDGEADDDTLDAGAGNDTVDGGSGDDVLFGGAGGDSLDGGGGTDTVSYADAAAGVTVDLVNPANNTGDAVGDSFVSIERFVLGFFADTFTGSIGNDWIRGLDGADTLSGGAGADTLLGELGNDTINDGTGIDVVNGGLGDDALFLSVDSVSDTVDGGAGTDKIDLFNAVTPTTVTFGATAFAGTTIGGGLGLNSFTGIERVLGSNLADTVTGGGGAEFVFGRDGNDVIAGRGGNDTISGDGGADALNGEDGDDVIIDGAGNDVVNGGLDNDAIFLSADSVSDTVDGGAGSDKIDLFYAVTPTTVTFGATAFAGTTIGGGLGLNSFTGIERVLGSNLADTVTGGAGAEFVFGRDGNDTIFGGQGNDTIFGDIGNDRLTGAGGADFVHGGAGNDTFVFSHQSQGADTFADFATATDKIEIARAGFGLAAGYALVFQTGAAAVGAAPVFLFNPAAKQFLFDADGGGAVAAVLLATLPVGSIAAGDILLV